MSSQHVRHHRGTVVASAIATVIMVLASTMNSIGPMNAMGTVVIISIRIHSDLSLSTSPQSRQSSSQSHRHGDEGYEVREGFRPPEGDEVREGFLTSFCVVGHVVPFLMFTNLSALIRIGL